MNPLDRDDASKDGHNEHQAKYDIPGVQAKDPFEDQAHKEELDHGASSSEEQPPLKAKTQHH